MNNIYREYMRDITNGAIYVVEFVDGVGDAVRYARVWDTRNLSERDEYPMADDEWQFCRPLEFEQDNGYEPWEPETML